MKISIVIISWNTKQVTRDCLRSLDQSLAADKLASQTEVIVVDNGSTDGSPAMIKKEFPHVTLILNRQNVGFGRANNQGIAKANGDRILLLNSDTIVFPGAVKKLSAFVEAHPRAGVVGPRLKNADGTPQPSAGSFPDPWTVFLMLFMEHFVPVRRVRAAFPKSRPVDWVMGAAMMCRAAALREVKGFDEGIFLYMEEVELCYRLKKAGWEVHYEPRAVITHLGGASSPAGRPAQIRHIFEGLTYFYRKHYPAYLQVWLRLMLKVKTVTVLGWGSIFRNGYAAKAYGERKGR